MRSWLAGAQQAGRDVRWIAKVAGIEVEHIVPAVPVGLEAFADGPASRYANAVLKAEREAAAEGVRDALNEATLANRYRLDRIATTENAANFNDGRAASVTESVDRAEVERKTGLVLVAYWDALLDACETCGWLDGKPEAEWGGERPGVVHQNCRCTEHYEIG